MTTKQNQQEPEEDQRSAAIPMDDQGASYSSSYNESTPGEVEENRRSSLHQQSSGESEGPPSGDRG